MALDEILARDVCETITQVAEEHAMPYSIVFAGNEEKLDKDSEEIDVVVFGEYNFKQNSDNFNLIIKQLKATFPKLYIFANSYLRNSTDSEHKLHLKFNHIDKGDFFTYTLLQKAILLYGPKVHQTYTFNKESIYQFVMRNIRRIQDLPVMLEQVKNRDAEFKERLKFATVSYTTITEIMERDYPDIIINPIEDLTFENLNDWFIDLSERLKV